MKSKLLLPCFMFIGFATVTHHTSAQQQHTASPSENLSNTILALDSEFWEAYNSCNIEGIQKFLTQDVEFYHDKGGLTTTRTALMESIATGLCGNKNHSTLRAAVEGSVHVYPLAQYGAIIVGEHLFYEKKANEKAVLVGKAKFTHVWQHKDNQWKMSRVLSYDHQAASMNSSKKEIVLPVEVLTKYAGAYTIADNQTAIVTVEGNGLKLSTTKKTFIIQPESKTMFFHKQAPLTFKFVTGDKGQIIKFIVRENEKIVDEAIRKE